MEMRISVLLLSIAFLFNRICVSVGESQTNDSNDGKKIDSAVSEKAADAESLRQEQSVKDGNALKEPPAYLRIVPACALVFIFMTGSISIFVWEKRKERKKKQEDIDAIEDEELNNDWIEHLRNRQRRKSVFQRVRTMSWSGSKSQKTENPVDVEKARKYKIYDDMLEKYWQTLDVLRKGARNAPKEDGNKRAARIKDLAQRHQVLSSNDSRKDQQNSENATGIDQYSLMLNEATAESESKFIEDIEEEPIIDPAKLHQRRRSSRFHKQAEVIIDDDETANQRSKLQESTGLSQSYLASQEHFPSVQVIAKGDQNAEDECLDDVLSHITPREMSALHRLHVKMRPKSLIENLAAIHRDSVAMAASMTALPTSSLYKGSMTGLSESPLPLQVMGRKRVKEWEADPQSGEIQSHELTVRGKQRMRSRPKSLYETGATKKKISNKKLRSRPSSMYMPHTIQEDKPTVQIIDIDSLKNLEDYALSSADEDHMMAKLEQQLIADVCDEHDLSKEEIKALENLLEDVVSYSKENLMEPKRKITKQYSLLSVQSASASASSVGSKLNRPDFSAQLSFTDSISLFDGIEEDRQEDKSEEMVLLSLSGVAASIPGSRSSLSAYDNN